MPFGVLGGGWTNASAAPPATDTVPAITVTAPESGPAGSTRTLEVPGLGSTPSWQLRLQARRHTQSELQERGVQRLADLVSSDASLTHAYSSEGYWDFLAVRGLVLDNTTNYRREGLPISGETSIPLDNKAAIDLFKGSSGVQAGVSAPGGLVNYVVKRPDQTVRSATLALTGGNSVLSAVDLGERFGPQQAFGLRVNAAHEHLNPPTDHLRGERHLLALAADWRPSATSELAFEIEHSRRQQASQTGNSLWGERVPSASQQSPDLNLNTQLWSLPVVMNATTGTLRWTQALRPDLQLKATVGSQRLLTDDHTVFGFGCTAEGWWDRYCSDGSYDAYDFRSEGEVRLTQAADVQLQGRSQMGTVAHHWTVGLQRSVHRTSLADSAFNLMPEAGQALNDSIVFTPAPAMVVPQASRRTGQTELSLSDHVILNPRWHAWGGLRHIRLDRSSGLSDGSRQGHHQQDFTTPWLALSHHFASGPHAYISWGEGVESKDVPPAGFSSNAGDALPAQKSRQWELGLKGQSQAWNWDLAWFRIVRPSTAVNAANELLMDGDVRHQGLDGRLAWHAGPWRMEASAMVLDAQRRHSRLTPYNGKEPVNVPDHTLKLNAAYALTTVPGLSVQGSLVHEASRMVLADNSLSIPAWQRVDAALFYRHPWARSAVSWRLAVDNVFDRRAWREAPNQFEHVYLFPLGGRRVSAAVTVDY